MSMRVFVDADACPVTDIAVRWAGALRLEATLVCDGAHRLEIAGARTITVDGGADSADFRLMRLLSPGDLLITQDHGLAAMALGLGALVLDQDGRAYTERSIDALLMQRHLSARQRRAGGRLRGPGKRRPAQDAAFQRALDALAGEMAEALRRLLRAHARRWPLWGLEDMMKLLYQREFGPGHLIADEGASLRRLEAEWRSAAPDPALPLLEDIGGGFERLHIAAARAAGLDAGRVHACFLRSADQPRGSAAGFEHSAAALTEALGVPAGRVEAFLRDWRAQGCPPFSHSAAYRAAYRPAYRVVFGRLARALAG